jgi:crotonobetainyl-CoA:carnitine CoA-transferase CaiB-like acyl-CoA transferase
LNRPPTSRAEHTGPAPTVPAPIPPLHGLRILTVSQFGAGPFGTQLLADLGAEVIKIEDAAVGGDIARHVGPYAGERDSLYFQSFNRGKKSITLDLKHPEGQAVLHDLARVSHGVYNNLRGDLPATLGLTYTALRDVNPAIVCCSLSGFGATGPRASEPAFDYLIQGYAGWMSITGEPAAPPGKCGVSVVDFAGGYASMAALLAGLWDAARSGVGRDIELSLLDTAVSMLSYFAIWTLNRDWQPARVADSGHQALVPAQNFPTRDGWIVVFCNKEKFWDALVDALELEAVGRDPRFATFAERLAHKDALVPILKARFAERTTAEWLVRLRGRVPCAPVNTIAQALQDEQVRARDMILEVKHPGFGVLREVASPVKTAGAITSPAPAPALGQHTDELLGGLLRYPPERIARLRASGALGTTP